MNIDRPNINRAMVTLFFEIKRNMPFEARDDMKISSPVIGKQLISIYQQSNNKPLRRLIEDFMQRAGAAWESQLSTPRKSKLTKVGESIITRVRAS
jgi:hypothetical protein